MNWLKKIVICIVICNFLTACNPGLDEQTRNVLQNAIDSINSQPGQWNTDITNAGDQIQKALNAAGKVSGQTTSDVKAVIADLKDLSTHIGDVTTKVTQYAATTTMCVGDFFGKRAMEGLKSILAQFNHQAPPHFQPWICAPNPNIVQLDVVNGQIVAVNSTGIIDIWGFNFSSDDMPVPSFSGSAANGSNPAPPKLTVNYVTSYDLQLDLQAAQFTGYVPPMVVKLTWSPNDNTMLELTVKEVPLCTSAQQRVNQQCICTNGGTGDQCVITPPVVANSAPPPLTIAQLSYVAFNSTDGLACGINPWVEVILRDGTHVPVNGLYWPCDGSDGSNHNGSNSGRFEARNAIDLSQYKIPITRKCDIKEVDLHFPGGDRWFLQEIKGYVTTSEAPTNWSAAIQVFDYGNEKISAHTFNGNAEIYHMPIQGC